MYQIIKFKMLETLITDMRLLGKLFFGVIRWFSAVYYVF